MSAEKAVDRWVDGWWCPCGVSETTRAMMRQSEAEGRIRGHMRVVHGRDWRPEDES